jgi:hypothetical protein
MAMRIHSFSKPTLRLSSSLNIPQIHQVSPIRLLFSTSPSRKTKPTRPEPLGDIKAHFPQKHETRNLTETKDTYISRWKQYVRDLSSSAAPKRHGGRSFGSRVRGVKLPEEKERLGKRERTIQKQIEKYGDVIEVEADKEEKGTGTGMSTGLWVC